MMHAREEELLEYSIGNWKVNINTARKYAVASVYRGYRVGWVNIIIPTVEVEKILRGEIDCDSDDSTNYYYCSLPKYVRRKLRTILRRLFGRST